MVSYVISTIILLFWLAAVPIFIGLPFVYALQSADTSGVRSNARTALICGYIALWAVFQVVAVGFILTTGKFDHVVYTFTGLSIAGAIAALVWSLLRKKEKIVREKRIGSLRISRAQSVWKNIWKLVFGVPFSWWHSFNL